MSDVSEIMYFQSDDPEIVQASKKAQKTFRWFWYQVATDYNRIIPAASGSMVKAAFSNDFDDPDQTVEHMFVQDPYFDGIELHGTLCSAPNYITGLAGGDEVSFPLDRVGDWMIEVGGVLYGGFVLQVVRSRLSPTELKDHDEAWGLTFPDIGINHIPERDNEFEEMITEHLTNALAENPKIVSDADEQQITALHREALFGRLATTKLLLENGAAPNAKCTRGWTPSDYAAAVGFDEVIALIKSFE